MRNEHLAPRDLLLILPAAALTGAALEAIQPGQFWRGWLAFSVLMALGLLALVWAWRWAGTGKLLAWMVGLSLLLRLGAGVAAYLALPLDGHDAPDDKAGFVFTDAHRRDDQAWELASSGKPLWAGFDRGFYTDQYGGLLVTSALTYRLLSPDAHRPLLILTLAALTAALGVPFVVKSTALMWNARLGAFTGWLFVLYPESVLTGGAQMREPFLLTLIAMAFWGFARWVSGGRTSSLWWMAVGLAGMLLVSPAMALVFLVVCAGWLWLKGGRVRPPWPLLATAGSLFVIGLFILAWSLSRRTDFAGGSPIAIVLNWLRSSVSFVIYELERGSGQIQNVFSKLNPFLQFLFVVGYGITQPVLPPAFLAPTTLTWHVIAAFRALGWYLILPLLLYAPFAFWRYEPPGGGRRIWLWLLSFCWIWIIICAVRAGGDQWDNPRYRLIFFGFTALVAGYAWYMWRDKRDPWLPRIVALEVVCLLLFSQWYLARYQRIGIHLPIMVVLGLNLASVLVIVAGGWLWDRRAVRTRGR
jgi:hypothetical protein